MAIKSDLDKKLKNEVEIDTSEAPTTNNTAIKDYSTDTVEETETSDPYEDALAKAKRDQNYKSYYNQAIQLYNMKNNANKYLSNSLASQGLNSQGYGSSARVGIGNTAANLYADAYSDYQANEQSITEDAISRYDENQTELDNQLVSYIQASGGDSDKINKYLTNYGYMDEEGNYTDKRNNLSEDRKAYLQSEIDNVSTSKNSSTVYSSLEDLNSGTYVNSKDEVETLGEHYAEEMKLIWHKASQGEYQDGSAIRITNSEGDTICMMWNGSGFVQISRAEYEKCTDKHSIDRWGKRNYYDFETTGE